MANEEAEMIVQMTLAGKLGNTYPNIEDIEVL